jgi:paraquat-inducible protein A
LSVEQMLGLVTGALLTFIIANAYPIVVLKMQGVINSATLSGSLLMLWSEGRRAMALLVFATTQLFPLLDLLALLALLLAVVRARSTGKPPGARPVWFSPLLRLVLALRPWGMTEVFMLGVLVALVKLSNMAQIVPGVALWAFGALTILLAAILAFDLRVLWDDSEP